MLNPVKSVKNHIHNNRAKYAGVVGFAAGVAVTHRAHQWVDFFTEIIEEADTVTA